MALIRHIKMELISDYHTSKIKYYKGLGTSSNKEAQEYFANIQKHRIDFEYKGEKDDESIDMAFNKRKTEERKNWLMNFDPNTPPLDLDISKMGRIKRKENKRMENKIL